MNLLKQWLMVTVVALLGCPKAIKAWIVLRGVRCVTVSAALGPAMLREASASAW